MDQEFLLHKFGNCLSVTRTYAQLLKDESYCSIVSKKQLQEIGKELELASRKMEFISQVIAGAFRAKVNGEAKSLQVTVDDFSHQFLSDHHIEFDWQEVDLLNSSDKENCENISDQELFKFFSQVMEMVSDQGQEIQEKNVKIIVGHEIVREQPDSKLESKLSIKSIKFTS